MKKNMVCASILFVVLMCLSASVVASQEQPLECLKCPGLKRQAEDAKAKAAKLLKNLNELGELHKQCEGNKEMMDDLRVNFEQRVERIQKLEAQIEIFDKERTTILAAHQLQLNELMSCQSENGKLKSELQSKMLELQQNKTKLNELSKTLSEQKAQLSKFGGQSQKHQLEKEQLRQGFNAQHKKENEQHEQKLANGQQDEMQKIQIQFASMRRQRNIIGLMLAAFAFLGCFFMHKNASISAVQ